MTIINGKTIYPSYSYRIKNNFEGSYNEFWYYINTQGTELHSHCTEEKKAIVYRGEELIKQVELIRKYKNANLIEV